MNAWAEIINYTTMKDREKLLDLTSVPVSLAYWLFIIMVQIMPTSSFTIPFAVPEPILRSV